MRAREREILGRVYACVNRLGTVGPRNPADIAGLARADHIVSRAAPDTASAISALGYGDFDLAEDYLNDAESELGIVPASNPTQGEEG